MSKAISKAELIDLIRDAIKANYYLASPTVASIDVANRLIENKIVDIQD